MNSTVSNTNDEWFERFSARLLLDSFIPFQSACGILVIFGVAAVGTAFQMREATATLTFVLLIVLFAMRSGFFQASLVAIAAIFCQTYFFELPLYTVNILTSRNAMAMVLFEATALIVSQLSAREKAHALESRNRRVKIERLFAVSRAALAIDLSRSVEQQLAELILKEFQLDAVAICNDKFNIAGVAGSWEADPRSVCQQVRSGISAYPQLLDGTLNAQLITGSGVIGTLLVRGPGLTQLGLESLASLAALTIERRHLHEREGEAQAARRTEQLRTTVLDGLAHAFKTPLTIIRAASSGLLEVGNMTPLQSELITMIDEQSAWLDDLANRLLQTAEVEGENLCLELETVDISALLYEVDADFQQEWTKGVKKGVITSPIHVSVPAKVVPISADHDMLRSTLSELLENAVKYSCTGKPISLSASHKGDELHLSVHSWGSVIRLEDRERIFERFYRCQDQHESAPGTGIGLSVARRTAEAHMGNIWVTSSEQEGTTFNISLPLHLASLEQEERKSNWQLNY